MAQTAEELRADMALRRAMIGATVEEIEDRVSPRRMVARGRSRMRERFSRWGDTIMGQARDVSGGMTERAGQIGDTMRETPHAIEERTRGNPLAVGMIAVGAGALIASLLPESRTEQRLARKIEPQMEEAASQIGEAGRKMASEVKDVASEGMGNVRQSIRQADDESMEEAPRAGEHIRTGPKPGAPESGPR